MYSVARPLHSPGQDPGVLMPSEVVQTVMLMLGYLHSRLVFQVLPGSVKALGANTVGNRQTLRSCELKPVRPEGITYLQECSRHLKTLHVVP